MHDQDEVQQKYFDPSEDSWFLYVVPILRMIPRAELARSGGVSERFIQYLRNGNGVRRRRPSECVRARLIQSAAQFARSKIGAKFHSDDRAECARFVRLSTARKRLRKG